VSTERSDFPRLLGECRLRLACAGIIDSMT
jgi:hypothetical protein